MPRPRGFHDVLQLGILRTPAEFVESFVRRRHELRRIASAPRLFYRRDFFTGDFLAHRDNFLHRVAIAVAKVEEAALARLQAEDVRLRQIFDVNVIADARSVRRRIIRAEYFQVRLLPVPPPARSESNASRCDDARRIFHSPQRR